jgi:hypothetical protein
MQRHSVTVSLASCVYRCWKCSIMRRTEPYPCHPSQSPHVSAACSAQHINATPRHARIFYGTVETTWPCKQSWSLSEHMSKGTKSQHPSVMLRSAAAAAAAGSPWSW